MLSLECSSQVRASDSDDALGDASLSEELGTIPQQLVERLALVQYTGNLLRRLLPDPPEGWVLGQVVGDALTGRGSS